MPCALSLIYTPLRLPTITGTTEKLFNSPCGAMQNLLLYYSDSLLNAYLNESKDTLVTITDSSHASTTSSMHRPVPEIAVQPAERHAYSQLASASTHLQSQIPDFPGARATFLGQSSPGQTSDVHTLSTARSGHLRMSVGSAVSLATSYNSLYSPVSENSDDLDLQSVRQQLDAIDVADSQTRLGKFKRLLKKEKEAPELDDDAKFMAHVCIKLQTSYYHYEKTSTLNVNWTEAAEVFFFGDTLDRLFGSQEVALNYILHSSLELGEPLFSNLSKFHDTKNMDCGGFLQQLSPNLARFNDVLDLYAESESNISLPQLFELFSSFANHADGLCIPLATSMFGRWLLAYNRDSAVESNYQNTLILNFFRKGARLALALEKVKDLFELDGFDRQTKLALLRYLNKDNQNALSIAMHSLAEYFQFEHNHNLSVTLWELNCHLTKDSDSGNLAILGLTDGYGFGNHIKQHNRLGKRSKTNKFNTKRRIAHLYRILMSQPGFDEYGVSWAMKEKYD